jgi:hypothetical protein
MATEGLPEEGGRASGDLAMAAPAAAGRVVATACEEHEYGVPA